MWHIAEALIGCRDQSEMMVSCLVGDIDGLWTKAMCIADYLGYRGTKDKVAMACSPGYAIH